MLSLRVTCHVIWIRIRLLMRHRKKNVFLEDHTRVCKPARQRCALFFFLFFPRTSLAPLFFYPLSIPTPSLSFFFQPYSTPSLIPYLFLLCSHPLIHSHNSLPINLHTKTTLIHVLHLQSHLPVGVQALLRRKRPPRQLKAGYRHTLLRGHSCQGAPLFISIANSLKIKL